MNYRRPLTHIAQEILEAHIQEGDITIDATMGNGHDTLFLAQQVGSSGTVYGFEVQQQAIDSSQRLLDEYEVSDRIKLCATGHQNMLSNIANEHHGKISTIMYNLGYLPGSDKSVTTEAESTLQSLEQSAELLQKGGIISIMAYRGHAGGLEETNAVHAWLDQKNHDGFELDMQESPGPILYVLKKTS